MAAAGALSPGPLSPGPVLTASLSSAGSISRTMTRKHCSKSERSVRISFASSFCKSVGFRAGIGPSPPRATATALPRPFCRLRACCSCSSATRWGS
eukprot:scaffold168198_cov31-Tisochrysis_lutea.AAC.5